MELRKIFLVENGNERQVRMGELKKGDRFKMFETEEEQFKLGKVEIFEALSDAYVDHIGSDGSDVWGIQVKEEEK